MIKLIAYIAAILTTSSFIPQALKTIKTRHTKDLSLGMYLSFCIGVLLWFVYGIFIQDLPIVLANGITFVFAFIILFLKIKYK
jgi:MtN3 and saliva related transmembrane protein